MAGAIGGAADMIGGAVTGLISGIQQYQMARYNADSAEATAVSQRNLMEYNAKMEDREAAFAVDEARQAEMRQRRQAEYFMSSQRAAAGASGVTNEGSPLAVFGETAANLEMSALDIRRQGEVSRWEHLARATNYRYQGTSLYNAGMAESKLQKYQGNMALLGGVWKAIDPVTFAGKGGSAMSMVSGFQKYSQQNNSSVNYAGKDAGFKMDTSGGNYAGANAGWGVNQGGFFK